ncbi:MAG: SEC-C metal-binding domain-containing protein [Candidatus Omnitrophota bacterium]
MTDEISDLLKKICSRETADYPIIEMEKLIGFRERAVEPIIDSLKHEEEAIRYCSSEEIENTFLDRLDAESVKPARSVKIGRNDPCSCGSGKKYKKCCGR